ncbi:dienelactone hydrolase family protein [Micromonospora sp. HM5-17]|jgi:carboxymethylenebutenolidase|uniref:dienelactone hydrolase family protein n=1 Tax=Micromonospora sp. HM5-17 TaxID=2487710 RepID=UPI000F46B5CE|nr:dienelactone hydrolase family protein [Micromonospora sp. HM5-17]ROT31502.1 dienelactone hydrolase family protein [Micromonospora sp. HM5-17]
MGEMVRYRSNGETSEGYLAIPDSDAASPAVIVIQEWWGLVPHITSVADRFAAAGFVALAPDLYRGVSTTEPDHAGRLLLGLAMDQAARDIAGAADYLAERPEVTGRIGSVGFCAGGSLALWSATLSERIVATVGFYPVLPWERMRPDWTDYTGKAALIHCAEEDGTSAAEGVQTARRAIEAAGGTCVLHDYPGTSHAFFNDDRPEVFDQPAAASSWARTLDFFRTRLG